MGIMEETSDMLLDCIQGGCLCDLPRYSDTIHE